MNTAASGSTWLTSKPPTRPGVWRLLSFTLPRTRTDYTTGSSLLMNIGLTSFRLASKGKLNSEQVE